MNTNPAAKPSLKALALEYTANEALRTALKDGAEVLVQIGDNDALSFQWNGINEDYDALRDTIDAILAERSHALKDEVMEAVVAKANGGA